MTRAYSRALGTLSQACGSVPSSPGSPATWLSSPNLRISMPPSTAATSAIFTRGVPEPMLGSMTFMAPGSISSPLTKTMSASATLRTLEGPGSNVCGSAPAGNSEKTSTRSPPTCSTMSPNTGRLVTTLIAPDLPPESPPQAASSTARRSADVMAAVRLTAGAASRPGGHRYWGAAGGAAAVELQPVALDLVLGGGRQLPDKVAYDALIEVLDVAAGDADQVMVVAAAAHPVVEAAVLQEDAANDVNLQEETHGAENRRAAYTASLMDDVVHGEVAAVR